MGSATLTTMDAMMKQLYPNGEPENVAIRNRAFLKMVPKKDGFVGSVQIWPVIYELPMGRSATFATAQSNTNPTSSIKWTVTRAKDYGVVTIDNELIESSKDNRGAFVQARKLEIDGILSALGRSASIALYRKGSGSIGQIATSGISSATITLTNPDDAANFGVGQKVVLSTADGGGTIEASGATLTVLSRDQDAGKITFTAGVVASISTAADADFIFTAGDYDAKMKGLAGHLPLTAPTSGDSFYGVDRSVDATRLAGQRVNATSNSIEENMLTCAEKVVREGGNADACFINHTNYSNLVKGLGSKVEYDEDGEVFVGKRAVRVYTSAGVVKVYPDPDCPPDRGYVLQMDTWTLWHLGGFPHFAQEDGLMALRQATADGIEIRARYWANLVCRAPGWNGVFAI